MQLHKLHKYRHSVLCVCGRACLKFHGYRQVPIPHCNIGHVYQSLASGIYNNNCCRGEKKTTSVYTTVVLLECLLCFLKPTTTIIRILYSFYTSSVTHPWSQQLFITGVTFLHITRITSSIYGNLLSFMA